MPSANKTPNLQLNQWLGNEYVKRQDFCDDNLKIDTKFKELDDKIKNANIELVDTKVNITDAQNKFYSTKLDGVLNELDNKINNKINTSDLYDTKVKITDYYNRFTSTTLDGVLDELYTKAGTGQGQTTPTTLAAANVTYTDGGGTKPQLGATNVQAAIEALFTKIRSLETENTNLKQRVRTLETELNGQATRLANDNTNLENQVGLVF